MTSKSRFRAGAPKKCWCGSGLKAKNCHGAITPETSKEHKQKSISQVLTQNLPAWGIPGEEQRIIAVPILEGQTTIPSQHEIGGQPGKYKVQLLLSRPGYTVKAEREHKFIDDILGDSHILIAKPLTERSPADVDRIRFDVNSGGQMIRFTGLPNDREYLGKLVVDDLSAINLQDAEARAYQSVAPFLSACSLHLDVPVNVETMQVTDLQNHTSTLRVLAPYLEMAFPPGTSPNLSAEFRQYASLYKEALNTNSPFYRFLCLYKIIESISLRRERIAGVDKRAGTEVRRFREELPRRREDLLKMLKEVYPWRTAWDELALDQMIPPEAVGRKLNHVKQKYLQPLRVGIAHALLKSEEIKITVDNFANIREVNKWLPLCRIIARLMLMHEFPKEFAFRFAEPPQDSAEQ